MKSTLWKLCAGLMLSSTAVAGAPSYDQLHPYYAEFCAVTQLSPLNESKGGPGGHGVLFLKGACRDTSRGYPRLKVCAPGSVDLSNPESGVSISVDKMFANVNWVGMDGKSFLINGRLAPDQPLDESARDRAIGEAVSKNLFEGISIHEQYLKSKLCDEFRSQCLLRSSPDSSRHAATDDRLFEHA